MIEQRKYARFVLEHETFAAIGNNYNIVGKVIDISLGGLSFEYILNRNLKKKYSKLDIFTFGSIFHLYNLPCNIIYNIDVNVPFVNNSFVKILTTKRSGLEFDELTEDDFLQIELFIKNNLKKFKE